MIFHPPTAVGTGPQRIIFDASTTIRWWGPPVGIARSERELVRYALRHRPEVIFAFFDATDMRYHAVDRQVLARFVEDRAVADMLGWGNPADTRRHSTDRIPRVLRPAAMWLLQSRRMVLRTLERLRLGAGTSPLADGIGRLQWVTTARKYRSMIWKDDGNRRAFLPREAIAGPVINFRPSDILVCAGSGWAHTNIAAIQGLKTEVGFRLVVLCYDIIPILFPRYFRSHDAEAFKTYFATAFAIADLVVCTAQAIRRDIGAYCDRAGLSLRAVAVTPLGADGLSGTPSGDLPPGLTAGRFAICVGTIEPRKGHRLLYEVWLRLLAEGIPQSTGFRLVFVGRPGWFVDDLMAALKTDPRLEGTLLLLHGISDDALATLYDKAAFSLFPSEYEGYGLPAVESLLRGTPVIASTGGSLPEVVGPFSPCLDPHDASPWHAMMKAWILDPAQPAAYADAIARDFRPVGWEQAAAQFFDAIDKPDSWSPALQDETEHIPQHHG